LPCGWSKDGLQLFSRSANEVIIDRNHYGKPFDNDFKENMKQELASTYKTKKRKRNCIDTYSDLLDRDLMVDSEEVHRDEENWVPQKGFAV
jgi:hypothetical protein